MAKSAYELVNCNHCQAVADAEVGRCWLCGAELVGATRYSPPRIGSTQESAKQAIGLSSVAGWVVAGVVLLGLSLMAPGLGMLVFILALPAIIRGGGTRSILGTLASIAGIVILCFVGLIIAVFAVCMVVIVHSR